MDHTTVSRQLMTSRYFLGELSEQEREEFEAHYFDCPECAADVRASFSFAVNVREALFAAPARANPKRQSRFGFWNWRLTALAAANLALVACVGYETLWLVPDLQSRLSRANAPQPAHVLVVPPAAKGEGEPIQVHVSDGVLTPLFDLGQRFDAYSYEITGPSGQRLSGDLAAPSGDQLPLSIPLAGLHPGNYRLSLKSRQGGVIQEIAQLRFQVQP